jgi:hypothetical protein
LGTLLAILTIAPAAAQQPSQEQISAIRSACRSDFMANCSGVTPGGRDALECLKRNLGKLSGSCKSAVSAVTPAAPAAAAPPAAKPAATAPAATETEAPPAATEPATPAAPAKPKSRPVAKTKPPAKPAVEPAAAEPPGAPPPTAAAPEGPPPAAPLLPPRVALMIVRTCTADRLAFCDGVPLGGGRIIACLMRNRGSLSEPCRDAFAAAGQ